MHIAKQELVSMIPVLMLELTPDDIVIDMCAAPGSKSLQALEMIGTKGLLLANELDAQRSYMLANQVMKSLVPNVIITNDDVLNLKTFNNTFTKVICDVPCSGDGTIRKNRRRASPGVRHNRAD